MAAQTPVLYEFIAGVAEIIRNRDGVKLQDFLQIEPPLSNIYYRMIQELRQQYPAGLPQSDNELLKRCQALIPQSKNTSPWLSFQTFMKLYFTFLRDVNVENLLETYNLLKTLVNQCVLSLGDSQMGVIVLPTVLHLSKVLAKLAMGLDRRPELIAHLLHMGSAIDQENVEKVTLVEQSANVVREAFIKCLTDRSGSAGIHGRPEGKRIGIYLLANLCLKLLFQCGKLRNAEQMFASISAQSPPLIHFPASQRVTYLYYLGRYLFSNNLFYPAAIALQAAYNQCHNQALSQRRLILSYLIPCNIVMGRFPSQTLFQRPEAQGLLEHFEPVCRLIVRGDYIAFREHLSVSSPAAQWFSRKGILLTLRNRCEILVWRAFCRKVFVLGGFNIDPQAQAQRGPPPFIYLQQLVAATQWLKSKHSISHLHGTTLSSPSHGAQTIYQPSDPDYAGMIERDGKSREEIERDIMQNYGDFLAPGGTFNAAGQWQKNRTGHLLEPNPRPDYEGCEFNPYAHSFGVSELLMCEIESILASMLTQGLIWGYLTHRNSRFAIPGARSRGALPTGFPNVWNTILAREKENESVPGWVQPPPATIMGAASGGRVVNLQLS